MRKFKLFALALICALSVLGTGCNSESTEQIAAEESGFGVKITLPGKTDRAVFYDVAEVSSYNITVTQNGYDVATKTGNPGDTVSIQLIDIGTYDISVSGLNASGSTIASGTASVTFENKREGYKDVEIDIYPDEKTVGIKAKAVWDESDTGKFTSADAVRYGVYILEDDKIVATYENVSTSSLLNSSYTVKIPFYSTYKIKIEAKNTNLEIVGEGEADFTISKGDTYKDVTVTIVGKNKDFGINASMVWVEPYKRETMQFGEWPQTIANLSDSEISSLTETGKEYDGHKEYSLSDGTKYVKVASATVLGDFKFSDGCTAFIGNTYYFKVEPIDWAIRSYKTKGSKTEKFLVAKKILTANVPYYGTYSGTRTIGENIIYPNNYKYSNIRAYLNSINNQFVTDGGTATDYDKDWSGKGFYTSAFSTSEKSKILETEVDNSVDSTGSSSNQYACENTKDKIFLLSYKEAWKNNLGYGSNSDRIMKPTDFALANNAYIYRQGCEWWLRSPYSYFDNDAQVVQDYGDDSFTNVFTDDCGVVPALTISE